MVGRHGEICINNNGERLIEISQQFDLKIMNSFFAHKDIHKFTWYQHTKGQKSIIDYLILKQNSELKTLDVRVRECSRA